MFNRRPAPGYTTRPGTDSETGEKGTALYSEHADVEVGVFRTKREAKAEARRRDRLNPNR